VTWNHLFGDGSLTKIEGQGTVCSSARTVTTNIVSLGQLEEDGCRILLLGGFLKIWDQKGVLLAKVGHATNMLYTLELNVVQPVCLAA
jgi:hypothetical protein